MYEINILTLEKYLNNSTKPMHTIRTIFETTRGKMEGKMAF